MILKVLKEELGDETVESWLVSMKRYLNQELFLVFLLRTLMLVECMSALITVG